MRFLLSLIFGLFVTAAHAQSGGTVTSHAFAIGKGAGVTGYTSLLCGSGQIAIGSAADPVCRTVSGDGAISAAGVLTLSNTAVTPGSYTNANVTVDSKGRVTAAASGSSSATPPGGTSGQVQYNNAGSFGGFTVSGDGTINTGTGALAITKTGGVTFGALATVTPGTGVATALAANVGAAGAPVVFNGDAGTPSALVATNASGTAAALTAGHVTTNANSTGDVTSVGNATTYNNVVPIAKGGTGQATAPLGLTALMPTPTRAGDIAYWNGSAWATVAGNNSGTQVLQETVAGVPSWATVSGTGTVTSVVCGGVTITGTGTCPSPFYPTNCTLAASVGSNILTVALKDNSGADASATSPCYVPFRSATATTGSITFATITAALSITTNATGATFGAQNSTAFRLWIVMFYNGGTPVLAFYNASTATSGGVVSACASINEGVVQTSAGVSGSATLGQTYYTPNATGAVTGSPIKIIGYVEYNATGLATAGTYATAPNFIQTFGPGVARPCEVIRAQIATQTTTQTVSTATTQTPVLSATATLSSAANLLRINIDGSGATSPATTSYGTLQASRGACVGGTLIGTQGVVNAASSGSNQYGPLNTRAFDKPNATSQAYNACGFNSVGTASFIWPADIGSFTNEPGTLTFEEIQG